MVSSSILFYQARVLLLCIFLRLKLHCCEKMFENMFENMLENMLENMFENIYMFENINIGNRNIGFCDNWKL